MTKEETAFAALVRGGMSLSEAYRRTHPGSESKKPATLRAAAKRLGDRVKRKMNHPETEAERDEVAVGAEVLDEVRQEVRTMLKGQIADDGELQAGLTELFRRAVDEDDRLSAVRIAAELRTWKGLLPRETTGEALAIEDVVAELNARPYLSIAKDL